MANKPHQRSKHWRHGVILWPWSSRDGSDEFIGSKLWWALTILERRRLCGCRLGKGMETGLSRAERGQNDPTEWEAFCCPLGNAGRSTLHLPSFVGLFCTPPFYCSFPHSVTPAPVLLPVLILPSFYICMVQNTISSTLNKSWTQWQFKKERSY